MVARSFEIADLAKRITEVVREELKVSSKGLPFRAWDIVPEKGNLHFVLEPEGQSFLDESMEEGRLAWEGSSAEIILVIPRIATVHACLATGRAPREGALVYLNPPGYLEALLKLWEQPELAIELATWVFRLGKNSIAWPHHIPASDFSGLCPSQRKSFDLVRWSTSFLWGPPGTGKTFTLGRMIASCLVHNPNERVLLLSSTNVAVDLAILEVDKALGVLKPKIRPSCYRFGSRFDPKKFNDRKHLLPLKDKLLVRKLEAHFESIPDPADADRYHAWKAERDRLREAIRNENRNFLSHARLVAMTTTLAAHDFNNLGRFDLVVFDEASQMGKVHALTFAYLGSRILFAGDPRQLAPIAQASNSEVAKWLGASDVPPSFLPIVNREAGFNIALQSAPSPP